jgi:hypothetical protein
LGSEGRESEQQVFLRPRLRAALERLNPGLPADAYAQALALLTQDRSKQIAVALLAFQPAGQSRARRSGARSALNGTGFRGGLLA